MTRKRRATITDVAHAAGVSKTAVSMFMNKLRRFSPEIEARIRQAVEELNYHQTLEARNTIVGQTRTVALAVQDIHNPYFTNVFGGASRVAQDNDYTVLIVDLKENPPGERIVLETLARRVDGLIVTSRNPEEDWLLELGKPLICMGSPGREKITTVHVNSWHGGYMMGRHLLETGRQRITYVGPPSRTKGAFFGLFDALSEVGMTPTRYDVSAPTLESGRLAASAVLLSEPRPDAVVCRNDLMAIGLIHEAKSLGLRVPEDVAVTGCDNIPFGQYVQPSLTTIDMRETEQGEIAMHKLLAAIQHKDTIEDIELEPRLIVGASTGKA